MKRSLILTAVLLFSVASYSLTLTEAIEKAMDENLQLQVQELSFSTAKLDEAKAVTSFLPKLTGSGTFLHLDTVPTTKTLNPATGMPMDIQVALQDNYSYDVKLTQPVFLGGKLVLGYLMTKDKAASAKNDLMKAKSDIKLSVIQLYLSGLLTEEMLSVNKKVLETKKEHLATVQARYGYGTASKIELLSSEIDVKNLEVQVLEMEKNRDNVYRTLNFIMGREVNEEISLSDTLGDYIPQMFDTLGIDSMTKESLVNIALQEKKEIKSAQLTRNIVKKSHLMNQLSFLPNVALFSQYTYKNYYSRYTADTIYYDGSINFGVSATVDIFSGGAKVIDVLKSGRQVKQTEMALSMLKEKTLLDIEYLKAGYENSKKSIEMFEATVLLSDEAYRTAQEQYSRGIISNNDYLDAETNFLKTRSGYLKAVYDKVISGISLLNSIGAL